MQNYDGLYTIVTALGSISEYIQSHSDRDNLSHHINIVQGQNQHMRRGERVRLQNDIAVFHCAPATRKSSSHFQKVDGPFRFVMPETAHNLCAFLVHLHDCAWRNQWVHHAILHPDVTVPETWPD